jgi:hypothetical protein
MKQEVTEDEGRGRKRARVVGEGTMKKMNEMKRERKWKDQMRKRKSRGG